MNHRPSHNNRLLNEAWQDAKNMANDTYTGLKRTVMDNMVLSIVLATAVLALLILCCYLRRRYSRSAQVVSKQEYKQLLRERKRRQREMEKRRGSDGRWSNSSSSSSQKGSSSARTSSRKKEEEDSSERRLAPRSRLREKAKLGNENRHRLVGEDREEESAAVVGSGRGGGGVFAANNMSMETIGTVGTMMSQEDIEYVGDVENGNEGFEVEVSPIKTRQEDERMSNGHYLEQDVDFEREESPQKNKRFQFLRKKNEQQYTI